MKTFTTRSEDTICEELDTMSDTHNKQEGKLEAFERLESARKSATKFADYDTEREKATDEKYGRIV